MVFSIRVMAGEISFGHLTRCHFHFDVTTTQTHTLMGRMLGNFLDDDDE